MLCALADRPYTAREGADLDHALMGTLALERGARRLSRLIEFLDPTDPEGMHAGLAPWCASAQGAYAWAFDNAKDAVTPLLASAAILGFDVTEFLDHAGCARRLRFICFTWYASCWTVGG